MIISDQYSVPSKPALSTVKEAPNLPMPVLSTAMHLFSAIPCRYSVLPSKNLPRAPGETWRA